MTVVREQRTCARALAVSCTSCRVPYRGELYTKLPERLDQKDEVSRSARGWWYQLIRQALLVQATTITLIYVRTIYTQRYSTVKSAIIERNRTGSWAPHVSIDMLVMCTCSVHDNCHMLPFSCNHLHQDGEQQLLPSFRLLVVPRGRTAQSTSRRGTISRNSGRCCASSFQHSEIRDCSSAGHLRGISGT